MAHHHDPDGPRGSRDVSEVSQVIAEQEALDLTTELPDDAVRRIVESSEAERDHRARFEAFHHRNPEVYDRIVELARAAVQAGHQRVGIAMLFEVLRYDSMVGHDRREDYKLNNDYKAFYARLVMDREPDLEGVFELRASRHADDGRGS